MHCRKIRCDKCIQAANVKRGCVHLYRSLDLTDQQITEIVQMRDENAYNNHTAAYNDCHLPGIPRFSNFNALINHAETVSRELTEKQNLKNGNLAGVEFEPVNFGFIT